MKKHQQRERRSTSPCLYWAHHWPKSQSLPWMSNCSRTQITNWGDTLVWQTPGNGNRGGIQRENDTGATVAPQNTSRANTAPQHIPGTFPAPQSNTADLGEQRHQQELLNRVVDMKTKLLESYFFLIYIFILLHFLTYIQFLCRL